MIHSPHDRLPLSRDRSGFQSLVAGEPQQVAGIVQELMDIHAADEMHCALCFGVLAPTK